VGNSQVLEEGVGKMSRDIGYGRGFFTTQRPISWRIKKVFSVFSVTQWLIKGES
jgi:hypothetical protein